MSAAPHSAPATLRTHAAALRPGLQPHAPQAAAPRSPGCSPTLPRLQPHAPQVSAVPYGARVFVIAGNSHGPLEDSFWMQLLRRKDGPRVSSWDVRTYLSESEAKE